MDDGPAPPIARPRVAAGALIRDAEGRILIVKPTYKQGWDIPGGYVEPGESPANACRRELKEELNLDRVPGRMLVVDWAPHPNEGDKLLFVFDAGYAPDPAELTPDGVEIRSFRFVSASEIGAFMPERLAKRIGTAISGPPDCYAENGSTRLPQC